ncbi:CsgG/HfaB family protein [Seleniivibrio sp.]|uniref:CsgG/HfaB family protein n=1 Tax=Seleniivibrio sp. TaxID=2898801 RepID=UPI0025FF52FC|nr:CsgG/HfaB family protein [Seleniivibrio sp.]MCD8553828.1 penicillin-binding protein activator LpoB [Seleniivibrio sp.]
MKKFFMFGFLCIFLVSCGPAVTTDIHKANLSPQFNRESVKRVAIIGFDKNFGIGYNTDIIADKFTAELVDGKLFSIMDRNDIDKVFTEVGFQQKSSYAGLLDDKTKNKLKAMGADSILTGKLVAYNQMEKGRDIYMSEVQLVAKLISIETGAVLWSSEISERSKADDKNEAASAEYLLTDIIEKMSKPLKSEGLVKNISKNLNLNLMK